MERVYRRGAVECQRVEEVMVNGEEGRIER